MWNLRSHWHLDFVVCVHGNITFWAYLNPLCTLECSFGIYWVICYARIVCILSLKVACASSIHRTRHFHTNSSTAVTSRYVQE